MVPPRADALHNGRFGGAPRHDGTHRKTEERSGGAGILGRYDDPTSRAKLQQLAGSDSDMGVRSAAIQALGQAGDRATLAYLISYPPPAADQHYLQSELKGAIAKLRKKFPE